ncbi:hypothetical protein ACLOJK_037517 [Asimina triloba]
MCICFSTLPEHHNTVLHLPPKKLPWPPAAYLHHLHRWQATCSVTGVKPLGQRLPSGIHHSNPNRPSHPHEPTSAATRSRANLGSHGRARRSDPSNDRQCPKIQIWAGTEPHQISTDNPSRHPVPISSSTQQQPTDGQQQIQQQGHLTVSKVVRQQQSSPPPNRIGHRHP